MSNRAKNVLMLVASFILSVSLTFSQDDFNKNILKYIEGAEKEKALRTNDECKLEYGLYKLLQLAEEADTSTTKKIELSNRLKENKLLHVDSKERMRVIIELKTKNDADSIAALIRSLDGEIEKIGLVPYIRCKIHPKKLRNLISNNSISLIEEEIPGHTRGIVSEGDVQLKADSARAKYLTYGFGVKIGVISDGVANLTDVKNAGELQNVTILNDSIANDCATGDRFNEGTAILEIVHDLASASELYFYSGAEGYRTMADGIVALKNSGCKVIIDDYGYYNEPYFTDEDNALGYAIRSFIAGGGVFVSAEGNDNYPASSVYSGITNIVGSINQFPNGQTYLEIEVPANSSGEIYFQWATRWYNPSDYDIYVYDETGTNTVGAGGKERQGMNVPPRERVYSISNNTSVMKVYRIIVKYGMHAIARL